jgi:lipopolysaccharide/colanic/teichoic acid biosynthesis glycosyltransferase
MRDIPDLLPAPSSNAESSITNARALTQATARVSLDDTRRISLISALPTGAYMSWGKRLLDIVLSLAAGAVVLPFVPFIALAVRFDTPGPLLYRSVRLGRHGRPFVFYKFRSMVVGAHESARYVRHLNEIQGPVFKSARDPRVTRVGRFLRRTSIDELPQLWNVLKGDMTLVGPRPPIPEEVEAYQPWQRLRLEVKPGITCLWQVSGRSKLGFEEWMRLDIQYIQAMSLRTDLRILLWTIPAVISREGAY